MSKTVTKSRDELLQKEYVDPDELGFILGYARRTIIDVYSFQPDFPPRVYTGKRKFVFDIRDVKKYLEGNK